MMFGRSFFAAFTCAVSLAAAGCSDPQQDGEIARLVDQELANSPVLGSADIDVAAERGVVTLAGVVASDEHVQTAEKLAWSVEGVKDVENRLEVSPIENGIQLPPVGAAPAPTEGEAR